MLPLIFFVSGDIVFVFVIVVFVVFVELVAGATVEAAVDRVAVCWLSVLQLLLLLCRCFAEK